MEPMNRAQRRHPERVEQAEQRETRPGETTPTNAPDEAMRGKDRMQDDLSVRAKNSGHGKKTADKWNQ